MPKRRNASFEGRQKHARVATFHTLKDFPDIYCVSGQFKYTLNESAEA